MLIASNIWPWFAAPSPNAPIEMRSVSPLSFYASEIPAATGICAPTIPFPP